MVRQVSIFVLVLALIFGLAVTAQADQITPDTSPSSSYNSYLEDIIPKLSIFDDYVLFGKKVNNITRSYLLVGDIELKGTRFVLNGEGDLYECGGIANNSLGMHKTNVTDITINDSNDYIIYSNLGGYPEIETRGDKYETLTTILLFSFIIGFILYLIFKPS